MEQARSEDEGALAALIDELFDNASRNANEEPRNAQIDLDVTQTGEDIANIGVSDEDEDDCDDAQAARSNDHSINEETDTVQCIVGSTKRKITCRLASFLISSWSLIILAGSKPPLLMAIISSAL